MRMRVFSGPDMKSVMAELRAAMGADAVILSTRQLKGGGIEIQAAVESAPRAPNGQGEIAEEIAREADLERRLREELLGVIRTETLRSKSAKRARLDGARTQIQDDHQIHPAKTEVRDDGWVRTGTFGIVTRRIRAPGAIEPDPRLLAAKGVTKRSAAPKPKTHAHDDAARVRHALEFHGVPKLLVADLVNSASVMETEDAVSALAYALDLRFNFDPVSALPRRPIMLVGAPGVGKTVTAAKLAARAVLLGRGVDMISTDTLRAGAREQMESFTSILKEKLISVGTCEELEAHLSELRDKGRKRPCIIDTPGTNPYARAELSDLRKFVKALDVEPVLVVAAGADAGELTDTAHIFATLGVQRMIATRIDAARRLGGILAAADSAKMNLAQFSMTPYIARGLSTMNPMSLARLLLDEPHGGAARAEEPAHEYLES